MKKNQKEVMKKGTNIILHTYARAYQQIKHNLQNKRTKYVGGNKILNKKKRKKNPVIFRSIRKMVKER